METTTPSSHMKSIIMRRVKTVWFLRRVLPLFIVETTVLVLVLQQIAEYVFVNQVVHNAAVHTFTRSPFMMADFFFRAFINTEIMVQTLLLASLVGGALVLHEFYRTYSKCLTRHPENFSRLSHVT